MKVWDEKKKKTVEMPYPNVVDESELVSLQIIDGMGEEEAEKKDEKFNFKNLIDLKKFNPAELFSIYSDILDELKKREIITTKNIVGEMGEYLVIDYFNNNSNLPNLSKAPVSTKNIDAISNEGKRYSIKSTSTGMTSVFHSIELNGQGQDFEYLIILKFNNTYKVENILQLTWDKFVKHRKIKKPENRYAINISSEVIEDSEIL